MAAREQTAAECNTDYLVGIIHFGLERQKLSAMNSKNLKCL